jgi:hypothetical protein
MWHATKLIGKPVKVQQRQKNRNLTDKNEDDKRRNQKDIHYETHEGRTYTNADNIADNYEQNIRTVLGNQVISLCD